VASLAAAAAKNQIDPNSKQQFIQTFYDQFIEKGYSPTLARQYAYIAAEKALAKVKGTGENLFGEEEETGGAAATGSTANTLDYGSLKD
jgi:flagellar motor switch protein FliG